VKEIFQDHNFLRYFLADALGKIADNYFFIFLTWLALQQTGSPAYAGVLLMANAIPRLVLMIFGGTLADKIAPQVILSIGNIVQAIGLLIIFIWLFFGAVPLAVLFGVAITFGAVDAFSAPASMSAVPRIVPRRLLLKANSLVQGTEMASFVTGAMVAGIVVQFGSLGLATAVNASIYIISVLLFFTVRLKFHDDTDTTEAEEPEFKKITAGLRYTWKKPVLRANTLLLAATNIAVSGPVTIGFLLLVTEKLGLGPVYYTVIFALFGIGTIIGALLTGFLKNVKGPGRIIIGNYIISGIGFILIGYADNIWLIIGASALLGILGGVAGTITNTWVQLHTRTAMLGRVSAVTMIVALAFDPFSQGLSGFIAGWSLEGLFVISGVFIIISTLIVALTNRVFLSNDELPLEKHSN